MTDPTGLAHTAPPAALDEPRESRLRGVSLLGRLASVFIVVVALAHWGVVAVAWHAHGLAQDAAAGDTGTVLRLDGSLILFETLSWLVIAMFVPAGVVFVWWLWRARANAEVILPDEHTHGRGWVIGSWICPVLNLWFPYQIVRDVWIASNPATVVPEHVWLGRGLRYARASGLLAAWWACILLVWVVRVVERRLARREPATMQEALDVIRSGYLWAIVGTVALTIAAALIVVGIRQISRWQTEAFERGVPAAG